MFVNTNYTISLNSCKTSKFISEVGLEQNITENEKSFKKNFINLVLKLVFLRVVQIPE